MVEVDLRQPSQVFRNVITMNTTVTGYPEEFNSKVSLNERQKNNIYAEDKRLKKGIKR
jgi:hypothetical protein